MAIFFALITMWAYGFDLYFIRKGLIESPYPLVAAFITLSTNFSFFVITSLIFLPSGLLKLNLVYIFIIAGVLAPGCARLLSYKGLETLGMSISGPILNAESLFPAVLGLIFLKEPLSLSLAIGVLSVVTGLVLLGYETGQRSKETNTSKRIRYRYLFYPITAALFFSVSVFLRKIGLNIVSSPILGATFTSGTSWCILASFLMTSGKVKGLFQIRRRSLIYFLIGGCSTSIAWLCLFYALNIGRVSIVSPITGSYSLITLFLSYVFLRKVERITLRIVIATILVVGGVILLSLVK